MDAIKNLNWIDLLVIIIVLRISYVSFNSGLSHEIFPLIGTIGTAVIALHYYHNIAQFIYDNAVKLPIKFLDFLAFVLMLAAAGFVFRLLRALSEKVIKVTWNPVVEKTGGLVLGFIRSLVVTSVVLILLALMPLSYMQHSIRDRSVTGMYFLRIVPGIYGKVSGAMPTFKVETKASDKEEVMKELVADKSVGPKGAVSREKTQK